MSIGLIARALLEIDEQVRTIEDALINGAVADMTDLEKRRGERRGLLRARGVLTDLVKGDDKGPTPRQGIG